MPKISITLLILFISISSIAQNQKSTLFFKNGTSIKGLAKIVGTDQVKFRQSKKSEKIIYNHTEIDRIIIRTNDIDTEFLYKNISGKKSPQLLEPIERGTVTLYRDLSQGYSPGIQTGTGMNGMTFGGHSYSISSYYVSKKGESEVVSLGSTELFTKNFKKAASNYFSNCPSLVAKIESKELKKRDVVEIVEYFNEFCGNQLKVSKQEITDEIQTNK